MTWGGNLPKVWTLNKGLFWHQSSSREVVIIIRRRHHRRLDFHSIDFYCKTCYCFAVINFTQNCPTQKLLLNLSRDQSFQKKIDDDDHDHDDYDHDHDVIVNDEVGGGGGDDDDGDGDGDSDDEALSEEIEGAAEPV